MPFEGKAEGRAYDIYPRSLEDPSPLVNSGKLYTKLDGGIVHLFYQTDDGTVYQITPPSAFNLVDSVFGRTGNVVAVPGDYGSDDIANDSGVAGAWVSDALDALLAAIAGLTSSAIANASGVVGATVTAALNTLNAALTSTGISNLSTVTGATVTAALNSLLTQLTGLSAALITNDSNVPGASVMAALNNLYVMGLKGIDARNATHTITSADVNRMQNFTAAGAVNLTINSNVLAANDVVPWCTTGAGTMTVNGTATLRSRGALLNSNGQYSYGAIVMLSATEALIVGDRA